jgi:phosphoribosylaminoimidazole (AIR) synthetase
MPPTCSRLIRTDGVDVHALSHVTGGGLAANLARVLPDHLHARVDRSTWTPPAVFEVRRPTRLGAAGPTSSAP